MTRNNILFLFLEIEVRSSIVSVLFQQKFNLAYVVKQIVEIKLIYLSKKMKFMKENLRHRNFYHFKSVIGLRVIFMKNILIKMLLLLGSHIC